MIKNKVQLLNPITKHWVKVDTKEGRIVGHHKGKPYVNIQIKAPKCPKCHSDKVHYCPGGTCYRPIPDINWLCEDCLNEW